MPLTILTISRQMGSLGDEIAEELSRKLGWELINRNKLINRFFSEITNAHEQHMLQESAKFYLSPSRCGKTYLDYLERSLFELSQKQSAILVGFGSQIIFAEDRDALLVRIVAPLNVRIARTKKQFHVSDTDADNILQMADKKHKKFVSTVFGIDLTDDFLYHLTLNTASLTIDACVAAILAMLKEWELRRQLEKEAVRLDVINHLSERSSFKNPTEIEFARILDMYQIEYKYEPKTFPIEWDAEGNVTLAFSPDFYLVQFNTYIELTTMNQKYVTMKNRKAKKVRELYPGTNIKIVYKKDFQSLVERFNMSGE